MGVRPAAMAGRFYPDDPRTLRLGVEQCLADARGGPGPVPKAIIAPHAGYQYSGPIAGSAYARLRPAAAQIKKVLLLGPAHRVAVRGFAVPSARAFETPLGRVPLDRAGLAELPVSDHAHAQEHSLEVHLPFLQVLLDAFELLPILVGEADTDAVAALIDQRWGGPETLVVVSTDLSHFYPYAEAQRLDQHTRERIEALDAEGLSRHACGRRPLRGLLRVAQRRGMQVQTLDLRNSGDTAGRKGEVVGYGAWVLNEVHP